MPDLKLSGIRKETGEIIILYDDGRYCLQLIHFGKVVGPVHGLVGVPIVIRGGLGVEFLVNALLPRQMVLIIIHLKYFY